MAPIGAHRCILAKFRRGELRVLQVCAGLIFNKSVHFSQFCVSGGLGQASHRLAYACLYIYKKVRKRNFPSGGHFF